MEPTQQTQIVKGVVMVTEGVVNLKHVLEQIGDVSPYVFRIYDFSDQKYHDMRSFLQNDDFPFTVPEHLLRP